MSTAAVPEPTLRRLPCYYHYLVRLRDAGQEMVSASQIGEHLDVHHTQVRKDLAYTGSQGRPKVGHRVAELIQSIETFLNWNNSTDAFLVGAGSLGTALLGYEGFSKAGVRIVAAFDRDPKKAGRKLHGISVLPMDKLEDLARRMHIAIAILTVPAEGAQEVASALVRGGVRAIWNFAPVPLSVPEGVIVESITLYASLAVLSRKLAVQRSASAAPEPA